MNERGLSHLDDQGKLRMVDVEHKPSTRRRAVAEAFLIANESVIGAIREGRTPKGDVFAAARLAGIAAAKRTSELIPLCHSIPLSHVSVDFDYGFEANSANADRIRIVATAVANAATGVEMEAITAVSVAALTLYDMLKALSHDMIIANVRLLEKTGGKSDYRRGDVASHGSNAARASQCHIVPPSVAPPLDHPVAKKPDPCRPVRAGVVTVSDRCASGSMTDTAGPAVVQLLEKQLDAVIAWCGVVPDDPEKISERLTELCASYPDLVVTVGGTGCGPRDISPEATRSVIEREVPGLAEVMRKSSRLQTPHSALQRGICGIRGQTLILNLPGSEKGACENLAAVLPLLPHAIELMQQGR